MFSHHQHRLAAANGLDQESSSFPLIAAVAAYLDGMAVGVSTLETMEAALWEKTFRDTFLGCPGGLGFEYADQVIATPPTVQVWQAIVISCQLSTCKNAKKKYFQKKAASLIVTQHNTTEWSWINLYKRWNLLQAY